MPQKTAFQAGTFPLYWVSPGLGETNVPTEDPYAWFRRVGSLISIPLLLGLSPVVGGALGWGLDRLFGTRPIFTALLLAAGFAAGIRETWRLIRKTSSEK